MPVYIRSAQTDKEGGEPNAIRMGDMSKRNNCKRVRIEMMLCAGKLQVLTKMKSLMYEDW